MVRNSLGKRGGAFVKKYFFQDFFFKDFFIIICLVQKCLWSYFLDHLRFNFLNKEKQLFLIDNGLKLILSLSWIVSNTFTKSLLLFNNIIMDKITIYSYSDIKKWNSIFQSSIKAQFSENGVNVIVLIQFSRHKGKESSSFEINLF